MQMNYRVAVNNLEPSSNVLWFNVLIENLLSELGEDTCVAIIDTGSTATSLDEQFAEKAIRLMPTKEEEVDSFVMTENGVELRKTKYKLATIKLNILGGPYGGITREEHPVRLRPVKHEIERSLTVEMILGMDFLKSVDIAHFVNLGNNKHNTLILSDEHPIPNRVIRSIIS